MLLSRESLTSQANLTLAMRACADTLGLDRPLVVVVVVFFFFKMSSFQSELLI